MASGEVLLNGNQLGNAGVSGFPLSTLSDANSITSWSTFSAGPTQPWAGIDAGSPCTLTRVLLSTPGGQEDQVIGSLIQASSVSTFAGPQGSLNTHITSSNTLSASFSNPNVAGSAIVVGIVFTNSVTVSTVVDTGLNSYSQAVTQNDAGNGLKQSLYVATNVAGGANTVTVTFSGSITYISLAIFEQPGIVASSAVDGTAAASLSSGSTSPSTGNFTTTQSGNMIIAMCLSGQSGGITPGGGFATQVTGVAGSNFVIMETEVSGASGTYSATATTPNIAWLIAAVALKASGSGFGSSFPTLATISSRATAGTLLNQYATTQSQTYQYYRYLSSAGSYGSIADIDFYATYTPGITAAAVAPQMSLWGGNFDQPVVVRLTSTTTDAVLYYTLDGTTPTTSSNAYTVPLVISSTSTLKTIAVSPGLTNSRVSSAKFYIAPNSIVSTDLTPLDTNRGYRVWAVDPWIFQDPVSGYWYMYGTNLDQSGVVTSGNIGLNIYRSTDLRNWSYQGITNTPGAGLAKDSATYYSRPACMYNALNGNYVFWTHTGAALLSYTSSSPSGPFTLVGSYSTLLSSSGVNSDFFIFLDSDGVTSYIGFGDTGLNNFYFAQLNTSYTAIIGTGGTYNIYASVATFGQKLDGPHMFRQGSTYFLMANLAANWTPSLTVYWTSSSPIGPFTLVGNPYQAVPGGVAGTYTDNTVAFNSQNNATLYIPGRNAYIYLGDAYNTGLNSSTGISTTANFEAYTMVLLPVTFPTPTTMSITWNANWNLDSAFPTVSGSPVAASNLTISGYTATWTNNELRPSSNYFDSSASSTFTTVISEVLPAGSTSFAVTFQTGPFYRIRTVNANGTSVSSTFPVTPSGVFNNILNNCSSSIVSISHNTASTSSNIPDGILRIQTQIATELTTYFRI